MIRARNFAAKLARHSGGNTLVIIGVALIPLAGMMGSGVDMARGYMAQARMQQACDAGALAGRRAMSQGTVDDTVRAEALKFFKFNYPTGTAGVAGSAAYGAKGFTPVVQAASNSPTTVVITASTTLPTAVMKIFGYSEMPLSVNCNAKQDFVNTDIVLVLDVTGSMDDYVSGTKKIDALRSAVLALYDELTPVQTQLQNAGLRLRYGIVPYSSGVNIGKQLREMSASYVVSDSWTYQSRKREWNQTTSTSNGSWSSYSLSNGSWTTTTHTANNSKTSNQCSDMLPDNEGPTYATITTVSTSPAPDGFGGTTTTTVQQRVATTVEYQKTWGVNDTNGNTRDCRIQKRTVTDTQRRTSTETYNYSWEYKPVPYDVSQYVLGSSVTTQTGSNGSNVTSTWAGCIEERDTVSTITTTTTTIPSGAKDLDVNLVPSDNNSRWRPYWPEVVYRPDNGSQPQVACPAQSKRLQTWTKSDLTTYLNSLVPTGGTYHDNGMRWGARLISSGGVFGPDNPTNYNNMPVSKHIIFMTDGIIDTGDTIYSTYGMERWDKRVTGGWTSDSDQTGRHDQRFKMMCAATKGMGVSIWVVAFASTLTSSLSECATNSAQASTSANQTELRAKFVEIGKNIGSLRLTK